MVKISTVLRAICCVVIFVLIGNYSLFAQLVGGQIFLPGQFLEIGQTPYGAFGTTSSPSTLHAYPTVGGNLGEVYDYGHDGWTVGTPAFYGDYTYPGSPFEGWAIQVGGSSGINYAFATAGISGAGSLTGSNVSYTSTGGRLLGNWAGTAAGGQLVINMETRIDTAASWVVMTVKFHNTGGTTLDSIYYVRSCDPDNDEAHGGSFATNNVVVYQNDADHRVLISANGTVTPSCYMGLGTKDCRARVFAYNSWPFSSTDFSVAYSNYDAAGGGEGTVGLPDNGDISIGLIYNIGNIAAGDSAEISYAYTFLNSNSGIDSAFPDPQLVTLGIAYDASDTVNGCTVSGSSFTANITNATDKNWYGSQWNWSPATGLSTTTGVSNTINLAAITTVTVYTITGTAAASCGAKTFFLTVTPQVQPIIAPFTSVCIGNVITLADATTGGTWTSSSTGIATVGSSTGIVTGVAAGTATITYANGWGCFKDTTISVLAPGSVGVITGATTVCVGATITQTDTPSGGVWSSTNTGVATVSGTGVVLGVAGGVDTIKYTISACGTSTAFHLITVNPLPVVSAITGLTNLCVGFNITLSDVTTGGTWSSTNTRATVTSGGVVHGVTAGIDTIKYSLTNSCGTTAATYTITINSMPSAGTITGLNTVCTGSTITLADTSVGGVWSAINGHATVSGGIVTGVSSGTDTIVYTVSNGCGSISAFYVITILSGPAAITPSGAATICLGTTTTLADVTTGGTWSSSASGIASVSSGGVVTGNAVGTATITYTVGSCYVTKLVSVINGPVPISPSSASVCVGNTTTFIDTSTGGTWASSAVGTATVSGGVVTGVATGTAIISYSVGSCVVTATVTVNASPAAITPSGAATICLGTTTTLADVTTGGTWSSSAAGIASVSSGGVVTGNAVGTATITYTVGSCYVTKLVSVISGPVAISPSSTSVCAGSTTTLSDATVGGVWTSSAVGTATVSGGVVTGVATGTAIISYSVGSCVVTATVTVNASPAAITPLGAVALCIGDVATLSDVTSSGVWSSSSASATITAGGVVTAVSIGTATISYTVGGCSATKIITVNSSPAAITPLSPTVCVGSTLSLSDVVLGGVWSSTTTGIATISATGVVTGVAGGTTLISYSIGTCVATTIVTVNPLPNAGIITGTVSSICIATTTTLTDGIAGGTWSASNGTATISSSGVVTGVANGTDTIYYSVSNTCGVSAASYIINVVSTPSVMSVTGPAIICQGSFALYTDSTVGGVWSMSNINATVTGTGVVTGITSGTDIITYTYTNACGTATATKTITITTLPTITPITGLTTVCAGATITLADATAGGTWSRTNTKATVTGTGVVTGITTGIDTIIYAVTNSCGTTRDSMAITINTIPSPGIISGAAFVCVGSIGTYTESVAGGVWTITNANATIATSAGDGVVSGIVLGMDTIIYTVTTACGTSATSKPISINPYPVAGVISGPLAVCTGTTISLTETMPGGVWSSGDIALATVSGTGVVTGLATGTDTISYTISGGCAVVGTWATIEVTALPNTSTITGPTAVCIGSSIMLTDTASGGTGTWINGSSHGSISSTGLFTGLTHGTDLVSYALTNMCGTGYATSLITVDTFPTAGFISWTDGVCVGSAVTLIDTTPGGIWVASNGNAMILALGIIWGVSPGIDTIFYIVTNSCGTADAIKILPVNALPVVAAITGATEICVGSITSLTDATTGGVWASSNSSIATIDIETGLVDGVAPGVVTITYTVTNSLGCPSSATLSLTVDAIPVIPAITGTTHQCVGTTTTLSDATAGGTWSSSNTVIATIDATGMVSGVTAGIVTITYTVTNICGTTNITKADTVNALPTIAPIISATSECVGANATLTDATPSGVWNSTDTTIATINPTTGVVTGVAAGTVNINYTVTNTHGCSASISISNTVNPLPVVLPITGITNECLTNTAMLADATVGGTWSSSNTAIASIDATGLVTGNAGGIVTISYSTTNSYGCVGAATTYDTVNTVPVATTITGTMHVCIGATTTLADASLWGVWTSATPTTATINAANGVITGVAAGTDIINYTVTNPCGMVIDTALITVYALPIVSPITGATITICAGASTVLSDETTGGTWSSSNTAIATVNSTTGVVTGVVAGADTIIYTVTNTNGCSISTTYPLTFGSYLGTSSVVPSSGTICGGHAVYMHVVTSAGSLTYQWLRNGVAIAGATNYNYTTDSVGSYSVIIGNGVCEETLTGTMVTLMATAVINFTAPNMLYTGSYASYQWYRNGIAIPGATNSIYFETLPGNYSVGVTDANGCSQTTNSYTIHGSGSSAVSIVGNNEDIRIYPNPATSMLFVDAPQPVNITIICADGRKVIEQPNTQSVNVSTLADGMYIIMLYNADGLLLKTDKFVKRN